MNEIENKNNRYVFKSQVIETVEVFFDEPVTIEEAIRRFKLNDYTDENVLQVEDRKFLEVEEW